MNDADLSLAPGHPTEVATRQARLEAVAAAQHRHCLLCGLANPFGMKLRFRVQQDGSVLAFFPCGPLLQSYPETLHGGAISALLDAAMTNALFSIGVVAVTAELSVRFLLPVNTSDVARVRGRVESSDSHPLYALRAELEQGGKVRARATAKFLPRTLT